MDDGEMADASGGVRVLRGMVGGWALVGFSDEDREAVSSGADGEVLVMDGAVVDAVSSGILDSGAGSEEDVRGFGIVALLGVVACVGPAFLGAGRV